MTQTLIVEGMSCGWCEATVEEALTAVSGVNSVEVDHTTDSAVVEGTAELDSVVTAVEDAGYDVTASKA